MLSDGLEAVRAFHEKFGLANATIPNLNFASLRVELIREEFHELKEAVHKKDMTKTADALADIMYVVLGAAVTWGIPLDKVFDAVHKANMTKDGGGTREDGKILKPEGWVGPEDTIRRLLTVEFINGCKNS